MEVIESTFLEYHQDRGFEIPNPHPLVIDDPTVLFTNATITPFKNMFSGDVPFNNYALVQKCLRLGGTGGNAETARTDTNYTSLFDMLGSGIFEISHDEAIDYFVDLLDALGLKRQNMIFSSLGAHALQLSLQSSVLDENQIRTFDNASELQHEWSFGEGDLHGIGVIAWYASEGYDRKPELSDCLQIGRIVHIDGISEASCVIPFDYNAFDVGLGLSRVELALTGKNEQALMPWRKLSKEFTESFDSISEGDAHYMANLCRVIDELVAEGVMPGNKKQSYVLRKVIRSLIEEVWLQSDDFVEVEEALGSFIDESLSKSSLVKAIADEKNSLRRILAQVETKRKKHPDMTLDELHATFGIKPSLLKLM